MLTNCNCYVSVTSGPHRVRERLAANGACNMQHNSALYMRLRVNTSVFLLSLQLQYFT